MEYMTGSLSEFTYDSKGNIHSKNDTAASGTVLMPDTTLGALYGK